ncbi:eCIS core domain-containing protein [Tenacibaculum caenipelagi]|uniref:Uncharacterized protein DUF4157 n=1 Tax=Tenacibaculum caenipelagi TaxID=1325435 RepID=A0A4R6TE32_9FLAO|nr:DUF4157 domain-containing protein [Tenacibaculum caenipelagi]TDQ22713.1 uncharacterized protein DUF4157 [Tenacibaculum caenipelagi]
MNFSSKIQKSKGSPAQKKSGSFIQPKLNVGKPGDKYEVEADKAADQIVAKEKESPNSFFAPTIQKKNEEEVQKQESNEQEIQQKPLVDSISPAVQLKSENIIQKQQEEELQQKKEEDIQKVSEEITETTSESNTNSRELVQQQTEDEIQEKEEEEIQEKEEEENQQLQMSGGDDTSSLESNLSSSKGGGSPLGTDTRNEMESGFGADFSGIRVHNDSNAVQMNKELGAQAFTNGNDIYFNEGKYNPTSESGKHLLAHELTHTVQQGASVQPKMIQKTEDEATEVPQTGTYYDFTTDPPKIFIDDLPIPAFKQGFMSSSNNFRAREFSGSSGRSGDNDAGQSTVWDGISSDGIHQKLLEGGLLNDRLYQISTTIRSGGRSKKFDRSGDAALLAQNLKVAFWDENDGAKENYEIDHKEELQLKGWPRIRTAGQIDNLHLLNKDANKTSGDDIKTNVNTAIKDLVRTDEETKDAVASKGVNVNRINDTLANAIKSRFDIHYRSFSTSSDPPVVKTWSKGNIEAGDHIPKLLSRQKGRGAVNFYDFQDPNPSPELPFDPHPASLNLEARIGSTSSYVLYWGDNLGNRSKIAWSDPNSIDQLASTNRFDPRLTMHGKFFNVESMQFNPAVETGQKGYLRGKPFKFRSVDGSRRLLELPEYYDWPIYKMPGTTYAGFLKSSDLKNFLNTTNAEFSLLSPFSIDTIQLTEAGLIGRGTLLPSVPFISRANIEIVITEDDVRLQKVFSSGDLDMPAPFNISDVTLALGYGIQNGFFIEGRVDFGIDNVGEGYIGAAASTAGGFALEGAFNFDSELFDPAEINVEYKENIWTIGGEIGIPEGKVRGIKNATITASYSENNFTATGTAELDIPGIERGTMTLNYGDEGFSISGNFDLSSDIPGIRGGNVEARVAKEAGAENYDIFVSGTAQPDIPGIDSSLTVTYENGALTIEGSASYNRGMLSGTVNVGATNRAIGDDGEPTGEPDDTMRVYGGGSLTLTLTSWLQATAGVNFLPNGEIEITGRIGLPDTVDIFDRQSVDRNLFNMPAIEIPIFAIPLGPRSIGVVARITGGLDFSAGFGPGQIRSLYADVVYNPDREDETTISGHGEFVIPADAGLTLRGDLGLGVSVGVASLTGGIEVAGSLGLEGEALAQVDVNWSPQSGLAIDALGRITVNPKFTFDINAFARASLDLWLLSISETWRYNLASFSWGPDIQFGIEFPVNYREGEPFNMSFEDLRVIYPELDIGDMLTDLGRDIKDDIF